MTTITHNADLRPMHTFGLHAVADTLITVTDADELRTLLPQLPSGKPIYVLGGGSNTVFTGDYHGTVIHLANNGIRPVVLPGHGESSDEKITIEADAGVVWDNLVQHCIANHWHGLENLAAIPGTVGAAPVQNVGAYGSEAAQYIELVNAIETATGKPVTFSRQECQFGYRSSIFKKQAAGLYVITSVVFSLSRTFSPNLEYKALREYLQSTVLRDPAAQLTPRLLADAVADLRWSKLPRPEVQGSAGSFFKNPVVDEPLYNQLVRQYPTMPAHLTSQGYKLSAGWLIEQAGWKGRTLDGAGTYSRNALVLCNCGSEQTPCTGTSVTRLAQAIQHDVQQKFNVTLEPEAILL